MWCAPETYALAHGLVVTVTSLREPLGHLLSFYAMWTPHGDSSCALHNRSCALERLPGWGSSGRAQGLQAKALVPEEDAAANCTRSDQVASLATRARRRLLGVFDVVGVADCTAAIASLWQQLNWQQP